MIYSSSIQTVKINKLYLVTPKKNVDEEIDGYFQYSWTERKVWNGENKKGEKALHLKSRGRRIVSAADQ